MENVGVPTYFMDNCNRLVFFMAILYIFPVLVRFTKKHLAAMVSTCSSCKGAKLMPTLGDQIGRIFAYGAIVFFGQFFLITGVAQSFG
jgi:hypothetical protein